MARHQLWLTLLVVAVVLAAPLQIVGSSRVTSAAAQDGGANEPVNLPITFNEEDGYIVPESVEPGWYLVTLSNESEIDIVADLVLLPDGREIDELQRSVTTESGGSTIPDWFEEVTFAGGPWAQAGEAGQTFIQLTPGIWHVLQIGRAESPIAELEVEDGPAPVEMPTFPHGVEVNLSPGSFAMPAEIPTGNYIWRVNNTDTLTHAFALVLLPAEMTYDEMLLMLETGQVPDDVKLDQAPTVGGIGLLSGNRTIWTVYDLNPGYYVALDYVPIKDGRTFAELGQFAMFIVK